MVDNFHWPPLESNPEIFTEYMAQLGLPDAWGFGEIFGFEEDLLAFVPKPVLAVIINMERLKKSEDKEKGSLDVKADFYMDQTGTLDNACGVIACLHAIFNNLSADKIDLVEGKTLKNFLSSVQSSNPAERATALEQATDFQSVHKGFASQGQSNLAGTQAEVKHHFVAFVINSEGQLIELDGTKKGPHVIAESCDDVLKGSVAEIQRRLADGEISESLSMMTLNAK